MPAIQKSYLMMGDQIMELSTENNVLNNKVGHYNEN